MGRTIINTARRTVANGIPAILKPLPPSDQCSTRLSKITWSGSAPSANAACPILIPQQAKPCPALTPASPVLFPMGSMNSAFLIARIRQQVLCIQVLRHLKPPTAAVPQTWSLSVIVAALLTPMIAASRVPAALASPTAAGWIRHGRENPVPFTPVALELPPARSIPAFKPPRPNTITG